MSAEVVNVESDRSEYDVSRITDSLFIASRPRRRHVEHVRGLGVDLVLSMIWFAPPRALTRPPFRLMRLPNFDSPLWPIPLFMLRRGAGAAAGALGQIRGRCNGVYPRSGTVRKKKDVGFLPR